MSDNEIVKELEKLYVEIAAMNGYITALTKVIDSSLGRIDEMTESIQKPDRSAYIEDHDCTKGEEDGCDGCESHGALSNEQAYESYKDDAIRELNSL